MSAKNAPGEVNNKGLFGSPNITSSEEDITSEVDKAAEEQKKRETVDIDGVPIDEKDIKYKSEDIRKKGKLNYFVNVEGAEERAKEAAKKKEIAKREAEKIAVAEKQDAERKKREEAEAVEKKKLDEKKQIEEVTAYIKRQKSEKAKKERNAKIANKFAANKKKLIIVGVALLVIASAAFAIAGIIAYINRDAGGYISDEDEAKADEKYTEKINQDQYFMATLNLDENEDLERALKNHDYEIVDLIYQEFLDKMDKDNDKARLYADKANRIWKADTRQKEQVMAAILAAYELDPDELSVLQTLQSVYTFYDEPEKAKEISEKIEKSLNNGEPFVPSENSVEIEG